MKYPVTLILIIIVIILLALVIHSSRENMSFTDEYMRHTYSKMNVNLNTTDMTLESCDSKNSKSCKKVYYLYNANPSAAREICNNKAITSQTLMAHDIPVSPFILLHKNTSMLDIELKRHPLKYPLVIKPVDGTHGNDVLVGIQTRTELEQQLKTLFTKTDAVIIEEQLEGNDYRILVVNGDVVDVVCRDFISIVGDGKTRIDDLIKRRNEKQLENKDHTTHNIDWELIARESGGLDGDGILAAGKEIMISNVRNYHNGANIKRIDIASIHPDNIAMLCKVNKAIGLVVSGVDFMTPDITKSYRENGGTIIEVNANPGLDIHVNPKDNRSSSMGELVVARLFA